MYHGVAVCLNWETESNTESGQEVTAVRDEVVEKSGLAHAANDFIQPLDDVLQLTT